ncbi:hypothetical protein J4E90_010623 [Alternaria incomplexa]|uniref:uncharacterized protein n=1 Tax=Alternaria incomplexa TaxID=1187928 RepID=UPI00221EB1FF|nr:uncharacterized protein J4E90_010623 [Alternaria incomplexa]KAI4906404.1 hypothetical protein J4E90_010623 [Alternaria incomplexa]
MTWQTEFWSWVSPPTVQTAEVPAVGQKAPSTSKLTIPAQDGKPTIITFLRHCGCPSVSHSDRAATDRWLASLPEPEKNTQPNLSIVVDAEREAYAAWGLGTSSLWHVLGSIPGTSKLSKEGISVRPTESGSRWQTAGNFGVDAQGVVRWSRVDGRADDMPDFKEGVDKVMGGKFETGGFAEAMQG